MFTSLTGMAVKENLEQTDVGISSVVDSWLLLRDIEIGGERNRGPTYRNRIRGDAERGERAMDREAAMVEAPAA